MITILSLLHSQPPKRLPYVRPLCAQRFVMSPTALLGCPGTSCPDSPESMQFGAFSQCHRKRSKVGIEIMFNAAVVSMIQLSVHIRVQTATSMYPRYKYWFGINYV